MPLDALAGLSGSTGGALLIYIGPALMTLKLREAQQAEGAGAVTVTQGAPSPIGASMPEGAASAGLWSMAFVGAVLAVIGTVDSISQTT